MPYADPEDQKKAARAHYLANKELYKARAAAHSKRQNQRIREMLRAAKNVPCLDCGVKYPFYVMQFDHRDGSTKTLTLGAIGSRGAYSLERVAREIAKCDVVCANCHAERTWQRAQLLVAEVGFEPTISGL